MAGKSEPIATARIRFLGDIAKLERLAIRHAWRGQGLGDRLLEFMLATARARGFRRFKLHGQSRLRAFYEKHGVKVISPAYECGQEKGEVSLMITKHCLRYSFNLCPKQVKGIRPDPMVLMNGSEKLTLRFDCKPCEMHVIGKLRKQRTIPIAVR